jgi:hypothetical protein
MSAEKREVEVTRLRSNLDDWKEVLVGLKQVVEWNKAHHPALIFGAVTSLFLLFWHFDPSFLSAVSFLFLVLTTCDFLLPLLSSRLFPPDAWNSQQEHQFYLICHSIVALKYEARAGFHATQSLKAERPRLYMALTLVVLLAVAWAGSALGDFMVLYFISVVLSLSPGAFKFPIVQNCFSKIKSLLIKAKDN